MKRLLARPEFAPFALLVAMIVVFQSINDAYLSTRNVSNLLTFMVELGLIAFAMTLLMTAGEFDLSVGAVFGFCPVVMWTLFNQDVLPLPLAAAASLLAAVAVGILNGIFVTKLAIPSFLVTLGSMLAVRGTALYITDGFPQRTWRAESHWLADVLVGQFEVGALNLHTSLLWFIAAFLVAAYVLSQTRVGNWIQASGGNPNAARARGVHVDRTKIALFIVSAIVSGFAGIVSSIRTSAANPNSGTTYELEVIAMVVIGGTAMRGGRGTIVGTLIGVLILRLMRNGIVLVGVPGLAYNIFIGAIILGMMAIHSGVDRRNRERG